MDKTVKEFIKQYKKEFRASFPRGGCKYLKVYEVDRKDNNIYFEVKYTSDLGIVGINKGFFFSIPSDILLNTELSFEEKLESANITDKNEGIGEYEYNLTHTLPDDIVKAFCEKHARDDGSQIFLGEFYRCVDDDTHEAWTNYEIDYWYGGDENYSYQVVIYNDVLRNQKLSPEEKADRMMVLYYPREPDRWGKEEN